MTLTTMTVTDFQNHEFCHVKFDPKLTTIIGPSDVGKSALLRALKWVCLNTPQGDSFVRDGQKSTAVSLGVDDVKIDRERSRTGNNLYRLSTVEEEFRAFNTSVPAPIEKVLNLDAINFVGQHEPPFWFCLTAGEVSRQLNAIVDLGIIDTALSNIAARVRKHQEESRVGMGRLQASREAKNSLAWTVKCDDDLAALELKEKKRTEVRLDREDLEMFLGYAKAEKKKIDDGKIEVDAIRKVGLIGVEANKISEQRKDLEETLSGARELESTVVRGYPDLSALMELEQTAEAAWTRRRDLNLLVDDAKRLKAKIRDVPDYSELAEIVDKKVSAAKKVLSLQALIREIKEWLQDLDYKNNEWAETYEEIQELTGGVCPVCGGVLK